MYFEAAVDVKTKLETTPEPSLVIVTVVLMSELLFPLNVGAEICKADTVLRQKAKIVYKINNFFIL